MLFNSLTFLIFLGVVLAFYYKLPFRGQNLFLLAASYLFYGWWDVRFLFLLLFTSFFDYGCALWIEGQPDRVKRKWLLAFSMALNSFPRCEGRSKKTTRLSNCRMSRPYAASWYLRTRSTAPE